MDRIFQLFLTDAVKISVPGLLAIVFALLVVRRSGPPRSKPDAKPGGRRGRRPRT